MSIVFRKCIGIALLVLPFLAIAQEEQGKYPADYDTNYIEDFRHRLNLALLFEIKQNTIDIITTQGKLVRYQTNLPIPNYGLMLSYRWLNVSLSVPIPGLSYVEEDKGNTSSIALGLGLTTRKWYIRGFYEHFKGYYLKNPENLYPIDLLDSATTVFPDMESTTYYGTFYYGFNGEKYSHRSLLWQSEIQKKSAGSFLAGVTGGFKSINAPEKVFQPDTIIIDDLSKARYAVVGLSLGYAHTFVLSKGFNFSIMLIPGVNYVNAAYSSNLVEESEFRNSVGLNAEGRAQLLYELENFYTGLSYTGYLVTNWTNNDFPVGSSHNYIKFTLGYRFRMKPIRFLKPFMLSN